MFTHFAFTELFYVSLRIVCHCPYKIVCMALCGIVLERLFCIKYVVSCVFERLYVWLFVEYLWGSFVIAYICHTSLTVIVFIIMMMTDLRLYSIQADWLGVLEDTEWIWQQHHHQIVPPAVCQLLFLHCLHRLLQGQVSSAPILVCAFGEAPPHLPMHG